MIANLRDEIEKLRTTAGMKLQLPDERIVRFSEVVSICQKLFAFELEFQSITMLKMDRLQKGKSTKAPPIQKNPIEHPDKVEETPIIEEGPELVSEELFFDVENSSKLHEIQLKKSTDSPKKVKPEHTSKHQKLQRFQGI
jgi:hypothetical protein